MDAAGPNTGGADGRALRRSMRTGYGERVHSNYVHSVPKDVVRASIMQKYHIRAKTYSYHVRDTNVSLLTADVRLLSAILDLLNTLGPPGRLPAVRGYVQSICPRVLLLRKCTVDWRHLMK